MNWALFAECWVLFGIAVTFFAIGTHDTKRFTWGQIVFGSALIFTLWPVFFFVLVAETDGDS